MATQKRRRAYIGNLRPRSNLSHLLYNNLFIPHCLPVKNFPDGDGIVIAQPKIGGGNNRGGGGSGGINSNAQSKPTSVYALVEFSDVEYAIQMLNGVQFDGRMLRVSREKSNNFGSGGFGGGSRGFGSSRWAGDDGGGGGRNNNKNSSRRGSQHNNNRRQSNNDAGAEGKSNAARDMSETDAPTKSIEGTEGKSKYNGALSAEEAINEGVGSLISSEIKESSDEVTAAIASTAAMTLLSSIDAFGLDEGDNATKNDTVESSGIEPDSKSGVDIINMTNKDFQSRCNRPLSDLLAEYGEQDVDWKKQQKLQTNDDNNNLQTQLAKSEKAMTNDDFQSRCQMPLSDLLAEYGEQDVDWKKDQPKPTPSNNTNNNAKHTKQNKSQPFQKEHKNNNSSNNKDNGMLAPFGRASIHLELLSFGYKYGAPSHSKQGFTYAQPLPPLDVRDLDRAPGHVAKFTGLSYLVKRALLNPSTTKGSNDDNDGGIDITENDEVDEDQGSINKGSSNGQSPMRNRANDVADEIVKVLVESIDEGGHGPISPLTMTVSIGSEYGRHRSVVLVEHLAVVLRARLRRNDGRRFNDSSDGDTAGPGKNGIVKQPVSVGTRHRDVEARHTDEEAFGEDLKREARKAEKIEKAKRRQMEGSGWDDNSW